jgi:hypothetical protein
MHSLDPKRLSNVARTTRSTEALATANAITTSTLNLFLGLILWFIHLTDFSWTGVWPDCLFTLFVGLLGFLSLRTTRNAPNRCLKYVQGFFCLPTILGCSLPVLATIILIFPPFTLGFMFMVDEMQGEVQIQSEISPDQSRVAEVYFTGVGAYSGGNGRILVRLKYHRFPWVERAIYRASKSYVDGNTRDYLYWVDDNTFFITETQQLVNVNRIDCELPWFLAILLLLLYFLLTPLLNAV